MEPKLLDATAVAFPFSFHFCDEMKAEEKVKSPVCSGESIITLKIFDQTLLGFRASCTMSCAVRCVCFINSLTPKKLF